MRRLLRMRYHKRFFRLLAMDHGLTLGPAGSSPTTKVSELASNCSELLDAIVLNYGLARTLDSGLEVPNLILQCFGAPAGNPKVKTTPIEVALELDAVAVSVQLDFGRSDLSEHIREVAKFTHEAHNVGMPVLFMTSGFNVDDALKVGEAIRVCQEVGADLIKTSLGRNLLSTSEGRESILEVSRTSPPVLLAGGELDAKFNEKLDLALDVGFSGYCVGRSMFHAADPIAVARALSELIRTKSERK